MEKKLTETKHVVIKPPDFGYAEFHIHGLDGPLVIHRFSAKVKQELTFKMGAGATAANKRNREPKDTDELYNDARYRDKEGWDGFHAAAIRNAMISACRVADFVMTKAKLSIFVQADGRDVLEPQVPLIRIYGEPIKQMDPARTSTGEVYITVRPAFYEWSAKVRIRWDKHQFTLDDVTNLLVRAGLQVGIGEGRPDSKKSAGLGWGLFTVGGDADADANQ